MTFLPENLYDNMLVIIQIKEVSQFKMTCKAELLSCSDLLFMENKYKI